VTTPLAPATLEGWYALHQMLALDWPALRALGTADREAVMRDAQALFQRIGEPGEPGWSAVFQLIGGGADLMLVHFRESLEAVGRAELQVRRSALGECSETVYDYLSVAEAGMYHATAETAAEAKPHTAEFAKLLQERLDAERGSPYLKTRLYPTPPEEMRCVSFYPMSKRRAVGQNWYTLPIEERNRLMREHGMTGRRYANRVFQIITGSIGLDDWEWGVTLFARDALEFKRIVTEMRYDEASSVYGEFGSFYTGVRLEAAAVGSLLFDGGA
jgi:hydrogen peroxide-dependent heme synthase